MAQLIDTSVFILLERRRVRLDALPIGDDESVALASITASELLMGVHRAETPERRIRREAFVERLLDTIPVLPFTLPVARLYARLSHDLQRQGLPIGAHDTMIAATALVHGYQLLTDNLRHFERIEGLRVQRPLLG